MECLFVPNAFTYFARRPSRLAKRAMQSSDSPIMRMAPQIAYTFVLLVMMPVCGSTSAKLSWTDAWSLAWMMRLLAELQWNKTEIFEVRFHYMQTHTRISWNEKRLKFSSISENANWMNHINVGNAMKTPGRLIMAIECEKKIESTHFSCTRKRHVELTIYGGSINQRNLQRRSPFWFAAIENELIQWISTNSAIICVDFDENYLLLFSENWRARQYRNGVPMWKRVGTTFDTTSHQRVVLCVCHSIDSSLVPGCPTFKQETHSVSAQFFENISRSIQIPFSSELNEERISCGWFKYFFLTLEPLPLD